MMQTAINDHREKSGNEKKRAEVELARFHALQTTRVLGASQWWEPMAAAAKLKTATSSPTITASLAFWRTNERWIGASSFSKDSFFSSNSSRCIFLRCS